MQLGGRTAGHIFLVIHYRILATPQYESFGTPGILI